jgi:5-methyltetrahydrofolate--homocysteine methyltransferase
METILRSRKKQVTISDSGPIVIIGEKINPTGRTKLSAAYRQGDIAYLRQLAVGQIAAGADVLDINAGIPDLDEVALLPQVVRAITSEVDCPLCLDSANPKALAAALEVAPGKPLINSVNGDDASLGSVLPIVKEFGAAVIGLTMDGRGIPNEPEVRVAIAGKILEMATNIGIATADVLIDPLVLTVGTDSEAGAITLRTIDLLRKEFGVNINLGASNVSFGLPDRSTINRAFLALSVAAGANCVITDPTKHTLFVRAIDLLLGRDEYAARYISHYRSLAERPD